MYILYTLYIYTIYIILRWLNDFDDDDAWEPVSARDDDDEAAAACCEGGGLLRSRGAYWRSRGATLASGAPILPEASFAIA